MEWIETNKELPQQGKKVLCCHNGGDISVRLRFKNDWILMPYIDSKQADTLPPELWAEIDFPRNLTGLFRVLYKEKVMNMDEYSEADPEGFDKMHKEFVEATGKPFPGKEEKM